jgi:hypothetical protein
MKQRQSEINKTRIITEEKWVISLARKADYLDNQHAFLILEGIKNNIPVIYFLEFVHKEWLNFWTRAGLNGPYGKIQYYCYPEGAQANISANLETNLLFQCPFSTMKIKLENKLSSRQWPINKDKALNLVEKIKEEAKSDAYPFNILGDESMFTASSAEISEKERGDNCFTWAKNQLASVDIKITENNLVNFLNNFVSVTELNIHPPLVNNWPTFFASTLKENSCKALTLAVTAVAVGTYFTYQKFSP